MQPLKITVRRQILLKTAFAALLVVFGNYLPPSGYILDISNENRKGLRYTLERLSYYLYNMSLDRIIFKWGNQTNNTPEINKFFGPGHVRMPAFSLRLMAL